MSRNNSNGAGSRLTGAGFGCLVLGGIGIGAGILSPLTFLKPVGIGCIILAVIFIILGVIVGAISSATRNVTNKLANSAFNSLDRAITNAVGGSFSDMPRGDVEAQPEKRLTNTSSSVFQKVQQDFSGINIDVYKLRAEAIVATACGAQSLDDEIKGYLATEFVSQFTSMIKHEGTYTKHQSGLVRYVNLSSASVKLIFEVTYRVGDNERKAEVTFSNIAQITEDASDKQRCCPTCRAVLTAESFAARHCLFCETPIFAASDWCCTAVKMDI